MREFRLPYVYALIDPRDQSIFYIGKGVGRRMYAHQAEVKRGSGALNNPVKVDRIHQILAAGLEVKHQIMACCRTDADAYEVERQLIAEYAGPQLTNANCGGAGNVSGPRAEVECDPFIMARRLFGNIQPFSDWLKRAARSAEDVQLYWFVHDHLMQIVKLCPTRT